MNMGKPALDLVVLRNRRPWLLIGVVGMVLFFRYTGGLGAGGAAVGGVAKGVKYATPGASLVSRTVRDAFVRLL